MNNINDNISLFQDRLIAVDGEFVLSETTDEMLNDIIEFIVSNSISSIVISEFTYRHSLRENLQEKIEVVADFEDQSHTIEDAKKLCAQADAGITGVDAIIADSGTLMVCSHNRGDRLCSSLPPVHIAIIDSDTNIYRDFGEFIADTPKDYTYVLITGPSRTADIEKKLILGAHGPKRVVVFLSAEDA